MSAENFRRLQENTKQMPPIFSYPSKLGDRKFLDQGKRTKPVLAPALVPGPRPGDKGTVGMRSGGDVPGVTGRSSRAGAGCVKGEVKGDYLDDLQGNPEVVDRIQSPG